MKRQRRPSRPLRRKAKPFKPNLAYMEEYERVLILRDALNVGGRLSAETLMRREPGRYQPQKLHAALRRLKRKGYLTGGQVGRMGFERRHPIYEVSLRTRAEFEGHDRIAA